MSISVTLFGSSRQIPETDEVDWGAETTSLLVDDTKGTEATVTRLDSETKYAAALGDTVSETFAANATLSAKGGRHRVSSTGGAIVMDTTTAIADGTKDGQELVLEGISDTLTIEIRDAANTKLNGLWVSSDGATIHLAWNSTRSAWVELSRSN